MIKKIVYVLFGSMTENLYEALCIGIFKKNGLEIEIIDLNKLFFNYDAPKIKQYNIVTINSYKELEEYFTKNNKETTLFNIQFNYETRFYKFFRLLTKYKLKISKFDIGYLPEPKFNNIKIHFKNPFWLLRRVFEKIFDKIIFKVKLIDIRYRVRFVAGKKAYDLAMQKNTPIVLSINYIDYEKFLDFRENNVLPKINFKKYFVFLDSYLHKHEDAQFLATYQDFSAERYLETLNKLFDYLEKRYGVNVVIAAHPKSNYINNEFKHRLVIKNDTVNLVKYCNGLISHWSTSISFAVLFYKPLIISYTHDIVRCFNGGYLYACAFAKELGCELINLDRKYMLFVPNKANKEAYDLYKYNYLTSKESENYTNEEIITEWLKKLKNF
jgi:hypothetical protein